jgi:uncharacterized membrane protein
MLFTIVGLGFTHVNPPLMEGLAVVGCGLLSLGWIHLRWSHLLWLGVIHHCLPALVSAHRRWVGSTIVIVIVVASTLSSLSCHLMDGKK